MKLQFDNNQPYQLQAIQSLIDIFKGQTYINNDFSLNADESIENLGQVIRNDLYLSNEQLLANIQSIQQQNQLELSSQLEFIDNTNYPNISIEMETGTGKTYVYLRSIFELNKNYGYKKFVIVVPSVAIREGVSKNLEITREHFKGLYGNIPYNFEIYDSSKTNALANFARSNAIQILIINIDSFNKDINTVNKTSERGIAPIEFIKAVNPIVIIDEPQSVDNTPISKKAIANLNPICCVRYSATHKDLYNQIYKLDPVNAYNLGLVKQIEVDASVINNNTSQAYVELIGFKSNTKSIFAILNIHYQDKDKICKKTVNVKDYDDLYKLSNCMNIYKEGYIINGINSQEKYIKFSNGNILEQGTPQGANQDELQKALIEATIENHLAKELEFKQKNLGIKVLSLFFLDKVKNYRDYDIQDYKGKFSIWFEQILQQKLQTKRYQDLYDFDIEKIHDGYFSRDKFKKFKDSNEKNTKDDNDTYNKIMKEKEKLLDIKEPLRFIFSHSALREGWDNPNVFQICTLNETHSIPKKRQELGRGLRLCVNQQGERIFDKSINILTVITNQSYKDFAESLQKEMQEDCNVIFSNKIKNKANREKLILKKNWKLDQNFLDLWNRIQHKTNYQVNYSTQELIAKASNRLKDLAIKKVVIQRQKYLHKYKTTDDNYIQLDSKILSSQNIDINNQFKIIDIFKYLENKTKLTRKTISQILIQSNCLNQIFNNPQDFLDEVAKAINQELKQLQVDGIKYEKNGENYDMMLFEHKEIQSYTNNLIQVKQQDKTLFNYIEFDSEIENEFTRDCESREDILFYIKLPNWFKIKTPIGNYNPDWALIKKEGQENKIYFVAETKHSKSIEDNLLLRQSEQLKITCGKKHFEQFIDESIIYKTVSSTSEL